MCFGIMPNGFRSLAHILAVLSALLSAIHFEEVSTICVAFSLCLFPKVLVARVFFVFFHKP